MSSSDEFRGSRSAGGHRPRHRANVSGDRVMRRIIQFTALLAALQFGAATKLQAADVLAPESLPSPTPANDAFDAPSVIKVLSTAGTTAENAGDRDEKTSSLNE